LIDYTFDATISIEEGKETAFIDEFVELCKKYGEFYACGLQEIVKEESINS